MSCTIATTTSEILLGVISQVNLKQMRSFVNIIPCATAFFVVIYYVPIMVIWTFGMDN
jgi:hypothetical protein